MSATAAVCAEASTRAGPKLLSVGRSHVGCVRTLNEDAFIECKERGLWAVADGMGGHHAGEVASAAVVDALERAPANSNALQVAMRATNEALLERGRELGGPVGSTVAVLTVEHETYSCHWAGDSRIYLYRDHHLRQLTRDHSYVQELVDAGVVTPEEARSHPRRHVITRAVGAAPVLELEQMSGALKCGDRFLICSDGLSSVVSDREIADHMRRAPLEQGAEKLIGLALARGAPDNVTVVLVNAEVRGATSRRAP